ncbi:VOC family protein [Solimicrobium silvestre]|uniref:VOC family protein n=1 Tax=Solimicrobium silvestre TaxID=2099400 RepID=UPI00105712AC|nr:VOC family protein [Solimicrobium silvestre]
MTHTKLPRLHQACPVLASLDFERSYQWYSQLGFHRAHDHPLVLKRDDVTLHFRACKESHIAATTSCRIAVHNIADWYEFCLNLQIVHPKAPLTTQPWGLQEFAVLDVDNNLLVFFS